MLPILRDLPVGVPLLNFRVSSYAHFWNSFYDGEEEVV